MTLFTAFIYVACIIGAIYLIVVIGRAMRGDDK